MTAQPQPLQPRDPDVLGNETALWRAVISQAIVDATAPTNLSGEADTRRARLWFQGNGKDFRHVCTLADLEPDTVRRFALQKIEQSIDIPPSAPRRKDTRTYEFGGKSQTADEWAAELGIIRSAFNRRLQRHRAGEWTVEQVFTPKPPKMVVKPLREPLRYEHESDALTVEQWANRLGITRQSMHLRLQLLGQGKLSAKRAFSPKAQGTRESTKRYLAFGESLTLTEWSKRLGIPKMTLAYRLKNGMSVEDALTAPSQRRQRSDEIKNSCDTGHDTGHDKPGVGNDFSNLAGTGGGSFARDLPAPNFVKA